MKQIRFLFLLIVLFPLNSFSQLLSFTPNSYVNSLKEGLWSEIDFYSYVNEAGVFQFKYGQHYVPLQVLAQGSYKKGKREGFWKRFQIVNESTDKKSNYRKGRLMSLLEYHQGVPSSLYIEYFENGKVEVLGQFEQYPVNRYDTLQVPDWKKADKGVMKDTIIHTTQVGEIVGNWYFFNDDGTLKKILSRAQLSNENNSLQDSALVTGWYFISNEPTNYKRQIDNSNKFYFIIPKPIVTAKNFKSNTLFHEKDCYALLTRLDSNGSAALYNNLKNGEGKELAFIVNDILMRTQSASDPQFARVEPKADPRAYGEVLTFPCNSKSKEELKRILPLIEHKK